MRTNRKTLRSLAAITTGALVAWIGSAFSQAAEPAPGELAAPVAEGVRKIFVPRPKGAGDTLDESSGSAAADQVDVVTTVLGDRLLGSVVSIAAGDKLHLTGDQFDGEVQVDVGALDAVVLRSTDKESGDDEVALTNGDRILGRLSTIAPDGISIETQAAGQLRISPKVVRSITFSRGTSVLAESNFAGGSLEPWTSRGGSWTVAEGALVCRNRGGSGNALLVKLDQKEAVTLVAKVQSLEGGSIRCDLVLFADTAEGSPNEGRYGRNSLFAMFHQSEYYLMCVNNGSANSIVNRSYGRPMQGGTLRLAYDPAAGKATLWLDSAELGQYDVPTKPASGQFVMFNSYFPLKVEYLTVYRGIVPPRGDDDGAVGAAATEEATVQFANRDRVSVASITLADGEITFRTTYGELKCPVANVERILFGKKSQEEPRRRKDDVRVRTAAGRMTLQFDRLTADSLVGQSEFLGEVKVRRSAVREIKFNLYR